MRALLVQQPDGPFVETELPTPIPGPGQVLVRIHASGVNPLDTKIRAGKGGHAKQPLPAILGLDMAGTVEQLGPGVTSFAVGDEVFGMPGGAGGNPGSLAEFIVADIRLIARKPAALSMVEAAALPLSVITAWEGLVDRAHVHAGQQVLIHAGAGGIGHIAIQIAKALDAEVFATVSAEKSAIVQRFGATPIDYKTTSVPEYVQSATDGLGFDIVYDMVGGPTLTPPSSLPGSTPVTSSVVSAGALTPSAHSRFAAPRTLASLRCTRSSPAWGVRTTARSSRRPPRSRTPANSDLSSRTSASPPETRKTSPPRTTASPPARSVKSS